MQQVVHLKGGIVRSDNLCLQNDTRSSRYSDSPSWIRQVIPFFPVTAQRSSFNYESGMPEVINHTHLIPS